MSNPPWNNSDWNFPNTELINKTIRQHLGVDNMQPEMTSLDDEIERAVSDINALVPAPKPPKEQFPFETLAHQAAEASIEAAQQALTKAQSFLEETKREAELHLEKIKARADALRDQIHRQEKLGCSILDAHREFHNGG